jgi:hypothetical protein
LVHYILEANEENILTSTSAAKEVSAGTDLSQAVQFTAESWRRVSTKSIRDCFAHCGFKHSDFEMPKKANSESDTILEAQHVRNYEDFSCTNNRLQCYNENEDYEEATVEQIAAEHQMASVDQETDKNDTTKREQMTNQDATKFIARLWLYSTQEGNEGSPVSALETCVDFAQLQSINITWYIQLIPNC